jgi:1-aminocyclopropane-1-carboxylate deaminase/D-cysteine desulfhydrase-like pyridoxal-dependent ACC family enzyme
MFQIPSPIVEIKDERLKNVRLWIKREDLIHPDISGNKWRKLKYNIAFAKKSGCETLLTKGGAFSNHIYATAAAGLHYGFRTIGIIRGEAVENPTLDFARKCGMILHFVDRQQFRQINADFDFPSIGIDNANSYFLPEGGTNTLALKGSAELVAETIAQMDVVPDFYCVAGGTGGTAAGIISALEGTRKTLVFSALKGDFLIKDIQDLLEKGENNWSLQSDYHFGGYAKFTPELITFMNDFHQKHDIPLGPIYTGKLLYGIFDLIEKDFFPKGANILAVHTGGLQGLAGFRFLHGDVLGYI